MALLVLGDARFHHRAVVPDQALHRPDAAIGERADRVPFDLPRHLLQHVDLVDFRAALHHPPHHPVHPAHALAAGGALAAALVLVELRQAGDRLDDVGGLVHHDHARRAQARLVLAQRVEIHQHVVADMLGQQRRGGAAGNDAEQVVPAAAHAAGIALDQLPHRDAHLGFHVAGLVHMALDAEDLGARVLRPAEAGEPGATAAQDGRNHRDGLDVVHRGGAAIEADRRRERRLQPGHALLALEGFDERRLFAADIRTGTAMQVEVEVPARPGRVRAEQPGLIGLVDRRLQDDSLVVVLAADVDVGGMSAHREARDQAALDQRLRIVADDVAVLAGAGLGLVAVYDEIGGAPVRRGLGHEAPLHAGREAGAATAAQARLLHLLDDPVPALGDDARRAVPVAAPPRLRQLPGMQPVEVGEDAVLVAQRHGLTPSPEGHGHRHPPSGCRAGSPPRRPARCTRARWRCPPAAARHASGTR